MVCAPEFTQEAANESESIEDAMKTLDSAKWQYTSWVWEAPHPGWGGRVTEPVFAVYPAELAAVADMPRSGNENPHARHDDCVMMAHTHDGWFLRDESFKEEFDRLKRAQRDAFAGKENPYAAGHCSGMADHQYGAMRTEEERSYAH